MPFVERALVDDSSYYYTSVALSYHCAIAITESSVYIDPFYAQSSDPTFMYLVNKKA